jgi:RNA polymerase sigma-70 factor, ECF subfamily
VNPKFRAALVLREIEGLSYEEIAEILEISLGTVKSRILRGRDALRKQLAERLEVNSATDWSPDLAEGIRHRRNETTHPDVCRYRVG